MTTRWIREKAPSDNYIATVKNLLLALGVPFDDERIRQDLEMSPYYPQVGSVSTALKRWGLPNEILSRSTNEHEGLPTPHIAVLKDGRFILVTRVHEGGDVDVVFSESGPGRISKDEYTQRWSGDCLTATKSATADARSREVASGHATFARLALTLVVGIAALALVVPSLSISTGVWAGILTAGFVLSILLSRVELGDTSITRRVCSLGSKSSCSGVLASPAAKLGPISMADVGVIYFGGAILALFLALVVSGGATPWLAVLALLALPYTLFSIGYQMYLKTYCPLCIAVQGVLWAQAGWLAACRLVEVPAVSMAALGTLALAFGGSALVWMLLKPALKKLQDLPALEVSLARFERNPELIGQRLEAVAATELPEAIIEVVLGADEPQLEVVAYLSPECAQCAKAHADLERLLSAYGSIFRLRYRMLGGVVGKGLQMMQALTRDVEDLDMARAATTLRDWYASRRSNTTWTAPTWSPTPSLQARVDAHIAVSKATTIAGVPAVFVDARPISNAIAISDLGYFFEALQEAGDAPDEDEE